MGLDPFGERLDALHPVERAHGLAFDGTQQARHPLVGEVLSLGAVGIKGLLEVLIISWFAHTHAGIESSAGKYVDGRQVLGQTKRVLPTKWRDRGAELDARRTLRRRCEYRQGSRDSVLEMAMAQPRTVKAQLLTEFDYFENTLVAGTRITCVEQTDREEAQLL